MITRIDLYDFDGTVARSPEKTPENLQLWNEKMPNRPFGGGWWGNENSLNIEVFNPQLIDPVKQDLLQSIADPSTYTVLLTGRIPRFSKIIKEILRQHGVPYLDAYFFNTEQRTLDFKLKVIEQLRQDFPAVTHFTMWEDRDEHIEHFKQWGDSTYGLNFKIHHIKA